ncbi:MAG: hypothetical protein WA655_15055 [Candidatus Korobacteraceae bacterium]
MVPRSFRLLHPIRSITFTSLVFLCLALLSIVASAAQTASLVTTSGGPRKGIGFIPDGCPNQGGIITSISVPVGQPGAQPLSLAILIPYPAPPGGYYFQVASEDPSIAAAGDPTQGLLPVVYIPEGQTESNAFLLYGISVGGTLLDVIPETPDILPFSVPTTAWDVDPGGDPNFSKFLNANYPGGLTCRDPGSPDLSSDPGILSVCGAPAQGIASDGVTQLLMRTVAGLPGTACYEVTSSGPPDQGMIQNQVVNTQSLGSGDYAFSFYQAPEGYGDSSASRTVQVEFYFTPSLGYGNTSTITTSLTVVRPPLLLIHGLWGSPSSWPSLWDRSGQSYVTQRADYSSTNAANYSTNYPKVQNFTATTLQAELDKGYAATQVDVTAHSMGGLLTRLYSGSPQFKRPDNFNMGDVHRLVTLDTPHFGASTANLLVSLNNNSLPFRILGGVGAAFQAIGFGSFTLYQGAVCDLAENSAALQGLSGGTTLPSQVITATGGPPGAPNGGNYMTAIEVLLDLPICLPSFPPICLPGTHLFPQDVVNGFRFRENNDAIVPLSSEQGGLGGTNYPTLIHTNVTGSSAVSGQVFPLLDGPDSGFSGTLPPVPSDGLGNPLTVPGRGVQLDQQDYAAQCHPGGPMNPNGPGSLHTAGKPLALGVGKLAADQRVKVTSPANGQRFAPGDTVNAVVTLTAPLQANAGYLSVGAPGLGVLDGTNYNGTTYQVSFVLPNNYAGPLTLTPDVVDSNDNPIEGVAATINVRPTSPPLSLTLVEGGYNHLLTSNATARVYVTGNYSNGVQRDLTSSVTGTTYQSSNTNVLTVDSEGNVQAKAFGTATITAQNSGLKAFAAFDVEDPANPLSPQDLTSGIGISRSGYRVDRTTGFYVQTITFTNSQAGPAVGPFYFVINGLTNGVRLVNSGTTRIIQPAGSPYLALHTADGITLQPGEHVTMTLQFLDANRLSITYTPKVLRTLTTP